MNKLRKITKPLAFLYGEIVKVRNKLYDKGILKSTAFDIPTIVVGNLSVGGTGKSPMIEYLVRLLKKDYRVAVLSRGYKRSTKGFQLATKESTAAQIGDEPLQFFKKFDDIIVAVDANRTNGITQLKKLENPPRVILLDDAFQHRKVQGGFNILLTSYDKLYVDDTMLPAGDLRENTAGAKRAQVIIVSKCPDDLSEEEQFKITQKLHVDVLQTVFFTTIHYAKEIKSREASLEVDNLKEYEVLLVTGIAKTKPLTDFLETRKINFTHLPYKDHYHFKESDIKKIETRFKTITSDKKIVLTTEKDYVRTFETSKLNVYYLPIETEFLSFGDSFDEKIKRYIEECSIT